MPIAVEVIIRGITTAQYDAIRAECGWLTEQPVGGLCHVTWWEGADCHNLDAWASEQDFQTFGEQRLAGAMQRAGVAAQPEVTMHPAHEVFLPQQYVDAPTAGTVAVDPVGFIRSGYEAFSRGDIPTVLGMFAPDIRWTTPDTIPNGGTFTGPAAVGGFFASLSTMYADLHVTPETFTANGSRVAVQGTHTGRALDGTPFTVPFVHMWAMRDGKATEFTELFDTIRMGRALGLVPAQTLSVDQPMAGSTA